MTSRDIDWENLEIPDADGGLGGLLILMKHVLHIVAAYQRVLTPIQQNPSKPSEDKGIQDPLALARDAARLIRAHGTKLSLLLINEPFTPKAMLRVVYELLQSPLQSLSASVHSCDSNIYTAVLRKELAYRVAKVFAELERLLRLIPEDGKVLSGESKEGGSGCLAVTGKLWAACDDVVSLAEMGVGGFFVKKAQEWRDTLKDVMQEMKEWGEEEPDDDDEDEVDDLADQLGDTSISKQDMVDDLMNSQATIPRSDPDRIRPRLDSSLKRLRMVVLLYQAISKRRFKKLPKDTTKSDMPQRLDKVALVIEQLPDKFGDLAGAFYELDPTEIDRLMEECFESAVGAGEVLKSGWEGEKDEFTEWVDKFQVEVKKT
ncbi:hypothetical protein FALBO_1732 [Fusarium albosuccineum]|uniref:Cyclin-D1-binding protein 1-like N-terminal domain-containing protein n=1 Tax=Fusarium albosuccineum TaxID=1237068 RepID=A0A8H4LPG5_9HYPO|nr:hypothetical protein FALBO_1732 [Fusarium albosuccineum]